ncbi:hypothetical protein Y032_0004g1895 [Ancylostoma ceylanicum]|uniref:Calx-beta domain-containing protein n=1 Tax=Ancylostoma ceylanicum TaxID=53326 RepID=A0A016VW70_9BILA|nr:hypothetical protein Y032_0004g1895 [Ancylostoma ceylanicum]
MQHPLHRSPENAVDETMTLSVLSVFVLVTIGGVWAEETCSQAKPCTPGVILPVWQPQTDLQECTIIFRAAIYLIALFYMFFGVSIVADRFMAAIEVITSQERGVKMKKITGEPYTILIRVWNETVSNLTLMALGSSAPEILLSVIEIFGNNFEAGELGPSTIVGSAAFNLFIIIAICIFVIPAGEIRRVQHVHVFWVTVVWSTFAYLWLYLILCVFSPNVVEVWEGLLTFIYFPLTVLSAYVADKYTGIFGHRILDNPINMFFARRRTPRRSPTKEKAVATVENGKEDHRLSLIQTTTDADALAFEEHRKQYLEIFKTLRAQHPDAPVEELEKLATERVVSRQKKSRAFYRIQATRQMVGQGDITKKKLRKKAEELIQPLVQKINMVVVQFDPAHYMCLENVGTIKVKVRCDRGAADPNCTVTVHYRTVADTAQEHSDFVPVEGMLTFKPGEEEQEIEIAIVDNDIYEDDEQFMVRLSQVRAHSPSQFTPIPVRLGAASTATVLIVDDDHAGAFGFTSEKFKVVESAGEFVAEVVRTRGARGEVSIPYKTIDGQAKAGDDYEHCEGTLRFSDEQIKAEIRIPIVNDDEYEKNEDFFIELGEPIWHRDMSETDEGIEGKPVLSLSRCKVVITEDKEFKSFVDRMLTNANTSIMVGTSSWKQQFNEAITVEEDEDGNITTKEKIMHYISLPWKLLFALIPPTDYYNGWLCFVVAIVMIGLLTAVIGDLASHFGCTVGMKDTVTAISLVAMGTSVPDTFASKTAAIQDKWADSSIGNVTGSNAVNVFLGIGIAWAIAACVHAWNGTQFVVNAGSLAFSVTMFIIGSIICIAVLQFRRFNKKIAGELGGPVRTKYICSAIFFLVWLAYLTLSTLEAYCVIPGF